MSDRTKTVDLGILDQDTGERYRFKILENRRLFRGTYIQLQRKVFWGYWERVGSACLNGTQGSIHTTMEQLLEDRIRFLQRRRRRK